MNNEYIEEIAEILHNLKMNVEVVGSSLTAADNTLGSLESQFRNIERLKKPRHTIRRDNFMGLDVFVIEENSIPIAYCRIVRMGYGFCRVEVKMGEKVYSTIVCDSSVQLQFEVERLFRKLYISI
jgi:hypothetical protein